ncbi:ThuA domain-containing protein [Maribacter sp. PR1]|uniref:ThuA domain-containing protein n=1 Tax=Maribacter cobaltidurans TaxID=1178778 RepID=A0ABU7IWT7_9FLAO|nr:MULTISPECIES: ThuA domain-containing protein [Maribacter]MDC6389871.1 ThuA domain-containing protein [Maribacter sp. PR1]MEE1977261.1 ThuA domain-containing protein [Maribacter cobaltidurans]
MLKKPIFKSLVLIATIILFTSCKEEKKPTVDTIEKTERRPHIVFVTGDEEYRSEESMPMLASIAKRELNAKVTVCYALDSLGIIDPNRIDHISNLEALENADLMVIFTRFRQLPKKERDYIANYVESGKPIVGFRTATHAFNYEDPSLAYWNNEWPTKVFGQQWITHHGHFDDGKFPVTQITKIDSSSVILNGFKPFEAYSWLYHVDGGDWKLYGDSKPILQGHSLKSQHQMDGNLDKFPLTNPVAWTKSYTAESGGKSRVFFTTLGHPYDFKIPEVRKIAMNGIFWALGKEKGIPDNGVNVELNTPYEPNNSGFGEKYKRNRKPQPIL